MKRGVRARPGQEGLAARDRLAGGHEHGVALGLREHGKLARGAQHDVAREVRGVPLGQVRLEPIRGDLVAAEGRGHGDVHAVEVTHAGGSWARDRTRVLPRVAVA